MASDKKEITISVKVDERTSESLSSLQRDIDCRLSVLVRACIEYGVPLIKAHPHLIDTLSLSCRKCQ